MQSLLEVLPEGDETLYRKAVETVTTCMRKVGMKSFPTGDSPEMELQPVRFTLPKMLLPGQRGIRLFTGAFSARDIQEPLLSFDAETLQNLEFGTTDPSAKMLGIRRNGIVTGYLTCEDLNSHSAPVERKFDPRQVVELEASLTDVIHVLTHFNSCFVSLDGTVVGVITRDEIEKPVVRMWLFGIIMLIEMLAVALILQKWPDESWKEKLSNGRLEKARELQAERQRRGFSADLVDCLQFADKIQLILKDPTFLEGAGFSSLSAARRALNDLESLRDDLAHGQDITRHDWVPILRLARRIEQLYGK
jgi:hypothetical protein